MAKSRHRNADQVERGQRIERQLRMRDNDESQFRNVSRMGWKQPEEDEDETIEDEVELA
jgi:hypothetical protein